MKQASWVLLAVSLTTASFAQEGGQNGYTATSRSAHETVWQRVEWITNQLGEAVTRTNEFVELATGLNHLSDEPPPQWQPSREEWEVFPDGIVARFGQHKVILSHSLNLAGAVDVLLPDGATRLISSPVSLGFYDPVDGKQMVIAEVRDCMAERGASANEIVFRNCFDRIHGSIRYLYTKAGVHQHVVLEQRLALPESFSDRSRLECYTVFDATTPGPQVTTRVLRRENDPLLRSLMVEPDFTDSELSFGGSMAIRAGKAFSLEDEAKANSIRVGKQWTEIGGLPVLIEAVEFKQLEPLLARLATGRQQDTSGLAFNSSRQIKRSQAQARLPREHFRGFQNQQTIQLASSPLSEPVVVIDYELLGSATNFTFKGDMTYYVSGSVNLSGNTTLEGTVVKFTNSTQAKITIIGPVRCQTGQYRPAIFTSKDDNSVGQTISGSTGNPTNINASGLVITSNSNALANLRFAFLYWALRFDLGLGGGQLDLNDIQFVKCRYPLTATLWFCFSDCTARLNVANVLASDCDLFFEGDSGVLRAEHLTLHRCNTFGFDAGYSAAYLTNSLLVAVSNWGNMTCTTNTTVRYATDPGGIFQMVGAGQYYLATNSPYRDIGTVNISSNLLASLQKKTTYPPVLLSNVTITASTNLVLRARRDKDLPDLGFHYDPLDFILAQYIVTNATLNLSNGVAIGYFNQAAGIWLQDNSAINSVGSPLSPNWFAHYTLVQEQPLYIGNVDLSSALAVNPYHYGNTGPNGFYRFTRFASPGGAYVLIHSAAWAYSNLWVQDCQLWNGWNYLEGTTNSVAVLKNNLFDRSSLDAYATASATLTLSNNLVRNTEVMLLNLDGASLWRIHDNAFDHCDVSSFWMPLTNSHNAYISCSGRLQPTNVNDVVLTNFSYVAGPLGNYYQSSTNLQNAGSVTNAGLAGLYHYTTLTNQTKEANSRLDIGFHYVTAVDNSGEPVDTDHGGIPDYLEDTNGDGIVNGSESDWRAGHAADDDLTGVYGSILVPRYLRCEYRQNPLGVETNYGLPRLYWIVTSNRRAQKQSAYRLLVASSEANLNLNYGDMWDSGVVPTDQTLHVEYKGNALASGQRLWWKVRSWDAWGSPSPWSTNAFFQMGLLSTNDWTAQWLTTATNPGDNISPMYRRAFVQLTNDIKRATAYVSAKGVYELWIDGQRIGPNILAPEWTDYNQRYQYQTYDVTTNLLSVNTDGTNHVIGAIVGEGWFHGSITHDAAGSYSYSNAYNNAHSPKQILVQLRIDRNDGSGNIVTSGSSWTCNTNGPIRYASIEHGETYDATKLASISNWSTFKYTGEGAVFTAPVATESLIVTQMFAQPTDPIQIVGYVQPIDMWTNRYAGPNGNRFVRVFDMGRVIEGWCILSLTNTNEPTGTNIYLRHANSLRLDANNRQVRGTNISDFSLCGLWGIPEQKAAQKETYVILQTNIVQQFQPHFTYHSFRFVEVDAPEDIPLSTNSLVGCVIRSSMPVTGAFDSSHRDVNQLMTNTLWTLEANAYGLPTACADRNERYGWFADTDVSAQTSAFLLDMGALWTKSLRDIRDAQWKETFNQGYVYYGAYDITNPRVPGAGVGDVGIESGGIVRPWRLYQNYGDTRALREHYLSSSNWLYYLATNWVANKLSQWIPHADILNGDYYNVWRVLPHDPAWPPSTSGYAQMNKPIHGLWAYIHSADLAASMSGVLQAQALAAGDTASASIYGSNYVSYSNMAANGRSYFANSANGLVSYDGQTGGINRIGNRTQGDYACALYFNMVPDNQRSNCVYLLLNEPNKGILDYNKNWLASCINHLSTGTFATGPAMHELTRNGYNSKAYELLTELSFPSWLYQITNGGPAYSGTIGTNYGATTCWERWNGWLSGSSGGYANTGVGTWSSFNELWNASVGEWVWRNVAGINPDDANAGFKNVIVYPRPGGGITNCSAAFNSIRGTIRSSWTNATSAYTLSVTVPPNATASVFLAGATNLASITESGVAATNTVGLLTTPTITNGTALFQIGSGSYTFNVSF